MPFRMASGITARVAQVLRDFLPGELALVDSEEGEFTSPLPLDSSIYEWDRPLIALFPAITMNVGVSRIHDLKSKGFGDRVHGDYELDLKYHSAIDTAADDGLKLQKLSFRAGTAVVRVLCDQKDGLETLADPVRFVTRVKPRLVNWGVALSTQETGQQVRTVVVGLDVEKIEYR